MESAQAVAHLVRYPAGNPFYLYHLKLWTILHQICALFLLAGIPEAALSKILSGLLGMVSFQALSLVVFAVCDDAVLAIGAAFVIVFSRIADHGVIYPVILLDTDHTYGTLGLSLFVLVAALFAIGYQRSSLFLLGLAPSVHPSLGLWLLITLAMAITWHLNANEIRNLPLRFFLAGCLITAVSLVVQVGMSSGGIPVDPAISSRYVRAFVAFWDPHRRPVSLLHPGVAMNGFGVLLAVLWINIFGRNLPPRALFILRMVIVTAGVGLICIFVSWIPVDSLPVSVLMLMPARLLNFNVMIYAALLFGLLGLYRGQILSQLLIMMLAGALMICSTSMFWDSPMWPAETAAARHIDPLLILTLASFGVLATGAIAYVRAAAEPGYGKVGTRALRVLSIALLGVAAATALILPLPPRQFLDRTNDPFFAAAASEHRGLMLTSGTFHLVQLYTRRPVLLDAGGLDSLPYVPESGPAMARILQDVYGIDLFHPPPDVRGAGAVPHGFNRAVWERFSREKWLSIGRTYDVTQVLTRSDYALDLPIAAENSYFRLYRIPD